MVSRGMRGPRAAPVVPAAYGPVPGGDARSPDFRTAIPRDDRPLSGARRAVRRRAALGGRRGRRRGGASKNGDGGGDERVRALEGGTGRPRARAAAPGRDRRGGQRPGGPRGGRGGAWR